MTNPTLAQMADAVGEAAGHVSALEALGTPLMSSSACPGCRARAEAEKWFREVETNAWRDGFAEGEAQGEANNE